jgi:glutathione S-transferase
LGEQFSVADAYCFTILNWLPNLETGLQLNDWPHIKAYQSAVATRPAVKAAMTAEGLL